MQRFSLIQLLNEYSLCIPAIQREYVQGYNEEKFNIIRNKLIDDIFEILQSDDENIILDIGIIYGYSEGKVFFPIDGQQRLTTLYVIYWFLFIKEMPLLNENMEKKSFDLFKLYYEARGSSTRFFEELLNPERVELFKSILRGKLVLLNELKSKEWFESEWLKDVTVLAVINVVSELNKKFSDRDEKFFSKAKSNFNRIEFSLGVSESDDARKNSSLEYAKINARGKQLEVFENVKSILSIIYEKLKIEDGFIDKYDNSYIDLFYDICDNDRDLESITKNINNKTMNMFINGYNILKFIDGNKDDLILTDMEYLKTILDVSRKDNIENIEFWKQYFSFLNNTLGNIFHIYITIDSEKKAKIIEPFKYFNEKIINFKEYKKDNKIIVNLIYYYHYYSNNDKFMDVDELDKFNYILDNLLYQNWKFHDLEKINIVIKKISEFKDIIDYFACENKESNYLFIEKNTTGVLYDISSRIREQYIKIKIIKENNLEYNYFKTLEDRFPKRSIYYLLYFSGYIERKTEKVGSFENLKKYFNVSENLFDTVTLNLRKDFALATYYDEEKEELYNCDRINNEINKRFINPNSVTKLEDKIKHYWEDEYYFIDDNLNDEKYLLRKEKLDVLKRMYNLVSQNKMDSLKDTINKEEYDICWLKHAVKNDYSQLFEREIKFENNKTYIYYSEYFWYPRFLNFFAYLYLLNMEKKNIETGKFTSEIFDITRRSQDETTSKGRYLNSKNYENKLIINPFEFKMIWEGERINYFLGKCFFYYWYKLELYCNDDSLFLSMNGYRILEYTFGNSEGCKVSSMYDFFEYRKEVENLTKKEELEFDKLDEKLRKFNSEPKVHDLKEIEVEINDIILYIKDKYNIKKTYHYTKIPIEKYVSKGSGEVYINKYKQVVLEVNVN